MTASGISKSTKSPEGELQTIDKTVDQLTDRCKFRPALRQIVTPEYITDSIAEGKLLDENGG
jgi:hypothetical protein